LPRPSSDFSSPLGWQIADDLVQSLHRYSYDLLCFKPATCAANRLSAKLISSW
jgi:hypothetical protein